MNCISQICCFHVALISCLAIIRVYHIFVSISTCALREEGNRLLKAQKEGKLYISIHALREEGDAIEKSQGELMLAFLSTPSARRATAVMDDGNIAGEISIHALREEGDQRGSAARLAAGYFYPRPPRGGRLKRGKMHPAPCKFLSTPSARRATLCDVADCLGHRISIHALREEGDLDHKAKHGYCGNFYPRPPRGGRLAIFMHNAGSFNISIHALREEGDLDALPALGYCLSISIHALREEGDADKAALGDSDG